MCCCHLEWAEGGRGARRDRPGARVGSGARSTAPDSASRSSEQESDQDPGEVLRRIRWPAPWLRRARGSRSRLPKSLRQSRCQRDRLLAEAAEDALRTRASSRGRGAGDTDPDEEGEVARAEPGRRGATWTRVDRAHRRGRAPEDQPKSTAGPTRHRGRFDESRRPGRGPFERARRVAVVGCRDPRGARGGGARDGPRGDLSGGGVGGGRRGGVAASGRWPARLRRRLPRAPWPVRRGRDRSGPAGARGRAIRRRRRACLGAVHGQADLQGPHGPRRRPAGRVPARP